ncbi:MAG: hypothetical protein AAGJ52_06070 [Pseudomonadota bacterium]
MRSKLLILIALIVGLAVVASDYFELRRFNDVAEERPIVSPVGPSAFDTWSLHPAARQAARNWASDPDHAKDVLAEAATHYPLEALHWLGQARIGAGHATENRARLTADLNAGVAVQPGNPAIQWQAAQIALHAGEFELSERFLKLWAQSNPREIGQALFIARRWLRNPDQLLDRIVPDSDAHWAAAMDFAFRQRERGLAEAVWRRVEQNQNLESPLFLTYLDSLLQAGEVRSATRLWASKDPRYQTGQILNGSFSWELGPSQGLNWRTRGLPEGVRLSRDFDEFMAPPASLLLDFQGSHNLQLRVPSIRIPLQPGQRYALRGAWQAQGLTTRARPYIRLRAVGGGFAERIDVPSAQFSWTEFSTTFTMPVESALLELSLGRDTTQAFDRYIGGRLWLDELVIETLPITPELAQSRSRE